MDEWGHLAGMHCARLVRIVLLLLLGVMAHLQFTAALLGRVVEQEQGVWMALEAHL